VLKKAPMRGQSPLVMPRDLSAERRQAGLDDLAFDEAVGRPRPSERAALGSTRALAKPKVGKQLALGT
jgi:hypothetical protein